MTSTDVRTRKAALREAALARREALDPAWRADASRRIAERVLALPELAEPSPVAGFWPIRSEVDPRPIMAALHERGQGLALPVVAGSALLFRAWTPGDPLLRRPFGLSEPADHAPAVRPAALLVPLACFDRSGNRIGYGRGFYDRALAELRFSSAVRAVGVAFSLQEVDEAPTDGHDQQLDAVITEAEVIRAGA